MHLVKDYSMQYLHPDVNFYQNVLFFTSRARAAPPVSLSSSATFRYNANGN